MIDVQFQETENPETDSLKYSQLAFNNNAKAIKQRKNSCPAIDKEMDTK